MLELLKEYFVFLNEEKKEIELDIFNLVYIRYAIVKKDINFEVTNEFCRKFADMFFFDDVDDAQQLKDKRLHKKGTVLIIQRELANFHDVVTFNPKMVKFINEHFILLDETNKQIELNNFNGNNVEVLIAKKDTTIENLKAFNQVLNANSSYRKMKKDNKFVIDRWDGNFVCVGKARKANDNVKQIFNDYFLILDDNGNKTKGEKFEYIIIKKDINFDIEEYERDFQELLNCDDNVFHSISKYQREEKKISKNFVLKKIFNEDEMEYRLCILSVDIYKSIAEEQKRLTKKLNKIEKIMEEI